MKVKPFLDGVEEPNYTYTITKLAVHFKRWLRVKADRVKNYPKYDAQYEAVVHGDFREILCTLMLLEDNYLDWCHRGFTLRRFKNETLIPRT